MSKQISPTPAAKPAAKRSKAALKLVAPSTAAEAVASWTAAEEVAPGVKVTSSVKPAKAAAKPAAAKAGKAAAKPAAAKAGKAAAKPAAAKPAPAKAAKAAKAAEAADDSGRWVAATLADLTAVQAKIDELGFSERRDAADPLMVRRNELILAAIEQGAGFSAIARARSVSTSTNRGLIRVLQGGKRI